ncbi:17347551-0a19-473c-95bb-0e093a496657 [Thermothielavioides terrestris]|uniref:Palmitoyl-protein thioesterase 1 n=1 Tax=Thermothielavioides terrestris TaxID=2587410 RepID=A0A446BS98_9PEZI|nr:17347551-0a19-473c-95bb-0e093a496657 [Thermothielavioides terrestris]
MAFFLRLTLLAIGLLVATSIAKPVERRFEDEDDTPLPLVIWHGLGDTFNSEGMARVVSIAEDVHPGIFVYPIRMDDDPSRDRFDSFVGNVTDHVAKACADIAADPILSTAPAIDALGFSQGGQFLRAYVERCNKPPVRSLITFGSQHNGITTFRECAVTDWVCRIAMAALKGDAWSQAVQSKLVPAQYYRNPDEYEQYLEHSNFLADINNERATKNEAYKKNIEKLESFVMYMFEEDKTVIPKESAWFGEVNGTESTPLRARKLYSEDWLGLRALDRKGGLKFRTAPGEHMKLSEELLKEAFAEFYGPLKRSSASRPRPGGGDDL